MRRLRGLAVTEYAVRYGVPASSVYQQIQRGLIVAVKTGGKMMVQSFQSKTPTCRP
jgi:hypothetical protein